MVKFNVPLLKVYDALQSMKTAKYLFTEYEKLRLTNENDKSKIERNHHKINNEYLKGLLKMFFCDDFVVCENLDYFYQTSKKSEP